MTVFEFQSTLKEEQPPESESIILQALWWVRKGNWDKAHELVQDDPGKEAAWVHAYLHRVEGDNFNAAYWYRIANRPVHTGALVEEWNELITEFLS